MTDSSSRFFVCILSKTRDSKENKRRNLNSNNYLKYVYRSPVTHGINRRIRLNRCSVDSRQNETKERQKKIRIKNK